MLEERCPPFSHEDNHQEIAPHHEPIVQLGNGSLAVVKLKKSLNQQIVDISSVFESRDVTVACRDPQLVQGYAELQTSSLLLSVASPFLKHVFDSVYETCDEPPKIVLPDFEPIHVAALLQYMQNGFCDCGSQEDQGMVFELVQILGVGREFTPPPSDRDQIMSFLGKLEPPGNPSFDSEMHLSDTMYGIFPEPQSHNVERDQEEQMVLDIKPVIGEPPIPTKSPPNRIESKKKKVPGRKGIKKKVGGDINNVTGLKPDPDRDNPACPVCKFDGESLESSLAHIESTMPESDPYQLPMLQTRKSGKMFCPVCQSFLKNDVRLRIHLKLHMSEVHQGTKYCTKCDPPKTFAKTSEYLSHLNLHSALKVGWKKESVVRKKLRQEKKSPACPVCRFDGGTLQSSVEHIETLLNRGYRDPPHPIPSMARASEKTLVCTICKYTASNEGCLRTHLRHHMKEAHDAVLKCETCSSQFDSTIDYFKHLPQHKLNSSRPPDEMRECPHCNKSVKAITLSNHIISCKRKLANDYIMCDKCDFKTTVKASLNGHYARKHGAERPFTCLECGKPFLRQGDLNQHVRRRHPAPGQEVICDLCGKTARDPYALYEHKRVNHTNKVTYQCKVCGQTFNDQSKMWRHLLIHSDLELYQCSICHKRFKNGPAGQCHRKTAHNGAGSLQLQKSEEYEEMKRSLIIKIENPSEDQFAPPPKPFKRFRGAAVTSAVHSVAQVAAATTIKNFN